MLNSKIPGLFISTSLSGHMENHEDISGDLDSSCCYETGEAFLTGSTGAHPLPTKSQYHALSFVLNASEFLCFDEMLKAF